jgi:ABC-type lipoprotein export system ATPase subunit
LGGRSHHRPTQLSGGEQQRVALARALVNRPSVLLADEPTGNLDSRTGEQIMRLIEQCNHALNMTVLLVTHERNLAERFARRMIFMADGRVAVSAAGAGMA